MATIRHFFGLSAEFPFRGQRLAVLPFGLAAANRAAYMLPPNKNLVSLARRPTRYG
jgi:hypothetical protein